MKKMINTINMKKFLLAILILFFVMPAFAAETRNINQLLKEYGQPGIPVQRENPEKKEQREYELRMSQARLMEVNRDYCEHMSEDFARLEGKKGKHPDVYWDYFKGECIYPESSVMPYTEVMIVNPVYFRY